MWLTHYVYRSFIFPFRLRIDGKKNAVVTVATAIAFNAINAFTNAFAISHVSNHLTPAWLLDPRFVIGVALFGTGYWINHQSDEILRNLRKPGETGYKVPRGGLYRWVSSPNYLGELIEWAGFALAAWTLPSLVFVLFTAANLIPRAVANHQWYQEKFSDYPSERRAIFPYAL